MDIYAVLGAFFIQKKTQMELKNETIKVLRTLTPQQIKALHTLIEYFESTEEHENEIPISDLFEDIFISVFIS